MATADDAVAESRLSVDEFKRLLLVENINNLIDKNEIIVGNVRQTIESSIKKFKEDPTDINYKHLKTMFDKITYFINEISEINWERMLAKIGMVVILENAKKYVKSKNPKMFIDTFLSQLNNTSICIEDDPSDLIKLYNTHLDLMDMNIQQTRKRNHHLIEFVKKLFVNCVKSMHNDSKHNIDITDYDANIINVDMSESEHSTMRDVNVDQTTNFLNSRKRNLEFFLNSNKRAKLN